MMRSRQRSVLVTLVGRKIDCIRVGIQGGQPLRDCLLDGPGAEKTEAAFR